MTQHLIMIAFTINLVLALAIGRHIILTAFDREDSLPFQVSKEQEPMQTFLKMLVRFGPYFSGFLGGNLLLQYLCRLEGKHFNEAQKEQGILLYVNQVIQNSVESFVIFWAGFLLFCVYGSPTPQEMNAAVWLFLLGRVLFAVGYYLGFLTGRVYLRTLGVVLQQVTVGIMLLRVFAGFDFLGPMRAPLAFLQ